MDDSMKRYLEGYALPLVVHIIEKVQERDILEEYKDVVIAELIDKTVSPRHYWMKDQSMKRSIMESKDEREGE